MHIFRSLTPYPAPGLLRCLSSSPTYYSYTSPPYTASQSRSYSSPFNPPAADNSSEHRKPTLPENSDRKSEGGVSSDDSRNNNTLTQPSPLASPSPDDIPRLTRRPIARLNIWDETTYIPRNPAIGDNGNRLLKNLEGHGSVSSPSNGRAIARSPNSKNDEGSNTRQKSPVQSPAQSPAQVPRGRPKRESYWARIILLNGVGTTLLESDIRRLVPGKKHIPGFKTEFDILRVSPYRLPRSLVRSRPFYSLVFSSPEAARKFVLGQSDTWLSHEIQNSTIPPGYKPRLHLVGDNSLYYDNYRSLLSTQSRGGCSPGACVLLVVSGAGGNTPETGKLPRTAELRQMLEDSDVRFCERDEEAGSAGLERIHFERTRPDGTKAVDKFDGSGKGAEGRWIVRCRDAAEAHRVVREWNKKEYREEIGKFKAEILY